jgi:hypothetical protein
MARFLAFFTPGVFSTGFFPGSSQPSASGLDPIVFLTGQVGNH